MLELLYSGLTVKYASYSELALADAVIPVPFNTFRKDNRIDNSNAAIARAAAKLAKYLDVPVYTQWEHCDLLAQFGVTIPAIYNGDRHTHISTHQFLKWVAGILEPGAYIAIVGHRHHVRRCVAVAKYYGLKPIVARESERVPYDATGGQWWASREHRFIPWEYASRILTILLAAVHRL